MARVRSSQATIVEAKEGINAMAIVGVTMDQATPGNLTESWIPSNGMKLALRHMRTGNGLKGTREDKVMMLSKKVETKRYSLFLITSRRS
jgi:hypothetical protein|mmetsp:Transcript_53430/g.84966  ORF Transcript_53430/g.84966 Transcript_53430/m.84966 type:complete len:90 (-) Transcript_53430:350-619(-)